MWPDIDVVPELQTILMQVNNDGGLTDPDKSIDALRT